MSLSGKPFLPVHSLSSSCCDLSCHPFLSSAVSKTTDSSYKAVRRERCSRQVSSAVTASWLRQPPVLSEDLMTGGSRVGYS